MIEREQIDNKANLRLIRDRILEHSVQTSSAEEAGVYMRMLCPDGRWDDIDYSSQAASNWPLLQHFNRLKLLSLAYADRESGLCEDAGALDAVRRGTDFWMARQWPNPNWWNVEMSPQQGMRYVALFAGQALGQKRIEAITAMLQDAVEDRWTGANRVWFAENVLFKGLLTAKPELVQAASLAIQQTVTRGWTDSVVQEEGLQPDGSFTQHHLMLYNNGYGAAWLDSASLWFYLLRGTPYAAEREKFEILAGAVLDGFRWMQRCEVIDHATCGREITRKQTGSAAKTGRAAYRLAEIAKAHRFPQEDELRRVADHCMCGGPPSKEGNRMFWRVDYMSHLRRDYFASVKMLSKGVVGSEAILQENQKGGYLSYGMTTFLRHGGEYFSMDGNPNIFPVWDWAHTPGVTAPALELSPDQTNGMDRDFVGGVSNGRFGAAAMDFEKEAAAGACFRFGGRKGYFFFDREAVLLGVGLHCDLETAPLDTTVNQCRLVGDVLADTGVIPDSQGCTVGEKTDARPINGSWVHHDGIGYVFFDPCTFYLKNGVQRGGWPRVTVSYPEENGKTIEEKVFLLYLTHGICPEQATYAYAVLPGMTADETARYQERPAVEILSNTPLLQAVRHAELGVTQMIFYQPGVCQISMELAVSVDLPCMLMVCERGTELEITASNPAVTDTALHIAAQTPREWVNYRVCFPAGEARRGQSQRAFPVL